MKKLIIILIFSFASLTSSYGQTWERLTTENSELHSNLINNLLFDASDNLWINAYSSIYMFDNDKQEWINFNKSNSEIGVKINSLYRDYNDNIWAAGESIYKFDRQQESWELFDSSKAEYVAVDNNGIIFIVRDLSVFYKEKDDWVLIFDGFKDDSPVTPSKLLLDKSNTLWFGIWSNAFDFYSFKNKNLVNHTKTDYNLPALGTTNLCVDSNNNIWVTSEEHAKTYEFISAENKWIKFDSTNSTLGKDNLYSKGICASNDGKIWLVPGKSFYFFPRFLTYQKNGEWEKFSIDEAFDLGQKETLLLLALAVDSKNNVWVGTDKGLIKFSETTTNVETSETNQINIYPNPVKEILTFDLKGKRAISYSITDIFGRELLKESTHLSGSNNIDIKFLTSGSYFIAFEFTNSETLTSKFVKE